jgi:predicted DNA-binding transcriptional regulator AlpA
MNIAQQNPHATAGSVPRWGTEEIAHFLTMSREHVTNRIIKRADFPKPIINVSRRTRYWSAADVRSWAAGHTH